MIDRMAYNSLHTSACQALYSGEGFRLSINEEYPGTDLDGLANDSWNFYGVFGECWDHMMGTADRGSVDDSMSDGILSILPDDPFGMDLTASSAISPNDSMSEDVLSILPDDPFGMDIAATFTAISGWIADFSRDNESDYCASSTGEIEVKSWDHEALDGFSYSWGVLQPTGNGKGLLNDKEPDIEPYDSVLASLNTEASMGFSQDEDWTVLDETKQFQDCGENFQETDAAAPHEALFFALGHMGVQELLSVEGVCRSLRDAVRGDPLLWRNICINRPFSERVNDDTLVWLTKRAQGNLKSLSLVGCLRVTDSGLKLVLNSNPGLSKLCLPECVKLSAEGVLYNLRALKSSGAPGIKQLRVRGIFGFTNSQFEELKFLLGMNDSTQLKFEKPRFYHMELSSVACDDDSPIDIETCPICREVRLVYDCPAEGCKGEHSLAKTCRGCILCIPRCSNCGHCIGDCDYVETFCLELICLQCWDDLVCRRQRQEDNPSPPAFIRGYCVCLRVTAY